MQGVLKLAPVDEIGADGVPPGHVAPYGVIGIVLEEQVEFAGEVDETVRIVGPVRPRRKVELRPVCLAIHARALSPACLESGDETRGVGDRA